MLYSLQAGGKFVTVAGIVDRNAIADVLAQIAQLLELKGENPFKVRAYSSGARALETLDEDLATLIEEERLDKVKGIGKTLAENITALYQSGELPFFDELKASVPTGLVAMLDIPGMGPKKIRKLHEVLGIETVEALKAACEAGDIAQVEGFGAKSQEKILSAIANAQAYNARHHWWLAQTVAEPILAGLRQLPQVLQAEHAGSLRRKRETVGDLDFIVASNEPQPIMDWFTTQPGVAEVTAKGETKASVRMEGGLQADLRVVPKEQFAFALHHFTGSVEHNVQMRQRALERGLTLSEWGLGKKDAQGKLDHETSARIGAEKDLFALLGLKFIEPELREGRGEIEAAEKGELPRLITKDDIRGVFHNHTNASDGRNTLEEMTAAAQALGLEYLGIADHSQASFQANGLSPERLEAQIDAIARLNASGKFTCHVFSGSEVDILKDGSLDFEDALLARLDYVVASVHNAFTLDEATMTARIIKAIENEHVTMLGHLTGRLLLRREPYAVNIPKVIDAAIANRTVIELNANPWRLDMDWRYWHAAADKGLRCAINPDAHDTAGLALYEAGVNVARKGWLTPQQVINCLPLKEVREFLHKR